MPRPRILIVDDEPGLCRSLSWYFDREGLEVHVRENGPDGLEAVRALRPDTVLLDLMLPGMHGLDVCRAVRADEATRHIPVVILTARAEPEDRALGFAAGADDYVTKPFSNRELVEKVTALLRRNKVTGDASGTITSPNGG